MVRGRVRPWSNQYYAPADDFYNNGQTSGTIKGTPFVDTAVPICGAAQPPPSPPVSAPTGVTATLGASNDVVVAWSAVANASGYSLYLDGQKLVQVGPITSFDYGELGCGKTYVPGVQSIASDGSTSAVATTTVTTSTCSSGGGGSGPEPTALSPPSGLSAIFTAQNHLVLSWNPAPGATNYNVYLNGGYLDRITGTSYDYGPVDCGKSFSPGVQSFAGGGQISTVAAVTVSSPACPGAPLDTTAPSTPGNLVRYFPGNTGFTVGWSASTDNVGVTGYDVYLNGSKIATVGAGDTVPALGSLGYVVNGLSCGTTYQVGVSAFDAAGNASGQATINAATADCPSSLPSPTGVHATVDANNSVVLYWDAVSGVSSYNLWLNGQLLLSVGGTSFGYGELTCGQTYTIGVQSSLNGQVSVVATTSVTTNTC